MATEIQEINDRQILVNEKLVEKDTEDRWIAKIELTTAETKALNTHLNRKKIIPEDATENKKP